MWEGRDDAQLVKEARRRVLIRRAHRPTLSTRPCIKTGGYIRWDDVLVIQRQGDNSWEMVQLISYARFKWGHHNQQHR